jgi:hypothetical protein
MFYHRSIFAELFGFVIFDLAGLVAFQREHHLSDDILDAFTSLDLGEQVSENGIAIPITDIPGDYYYWSVCNPESELSHLKGAQVIIKSGGWLLYTTQGEVTVCGIGYLKKLDATYFSNTDKFVRLQLSAGWNEVTIVGGIDNEERLVYELRVTPKLEKPSFNASFEDNFSLIAD